MSPKNKRLQKISAARGSAPSAIFQSKLLSSNNRMFTITFLLAIIKSGVWVFPAIYASFLVSQDPFSQPFSNPDDQYLMTTWFASFFANLLGIRALSDFIGLHFVFAILAILLIFRYAKSKTDKETRSRTLLLFAILPAVSTVFYWVGMDSFTMLVMAVFLNLRTRVLPALAIGLIGGLHHFEILVVSSASLLIYELFRTKSFFKEKSFRACASLILGLVSGKLLLNLMFRLNDVVVSKNRTDIGLDGVISNLELLEHYGILIYWSMLGPVWFLVAYACYKKNREVIALVISLAIPMIAVLFVRDSSRVLQLTSFLPIAVGLLSNKAILKTLTPKQLRYLWIVWILTPWVWIWQGIHGSVSLYTLKFLQSKLFGIDAIPASVNITMWPFV